MQKFCKDRLEEGATVDFFEPIKKKNMKTFSSKTVNISVKDRELPIKVHRNLFGQIAIIMQKRNIDLKEVFAYPIGPLPCSLAGVMGELRKTRKVALVHKIEKGIRPLEQLPQSHAAIIDGVVVVQTFKATGLTFDQLADDMLHSIINACIRCV